MANTHSDAHPPTHPPTHTPTPTHPHPHTNVHIWAWVKVCAHSYTTPASFWHNMLHISNDNWSHPATRQSQTVHTHLFGKSNFFTKSMNMPLACTHQESAMLGEPLDRARRTHVSAQHWARSIQLLWTSHVRNKLASINQHTNKHLPIVWLSVQVHVRISEWVCVLTWIQCLHVKLTERTYVSGKLFVQVVMLYRCVYFHWEVALQKAEQNLLGEWYEPLRNARAKHLIGQTGLHRKRNECTLNIYYMTLFKTKGSNTVCTRKVGTKINTGTGGQLE